MEKVPCLVLLFTVLFSVAAGQAPTNGLVAYYPLNGNATDATGNGNNGVIYGGVTPGLDRSGNSGGALVFNGTGYITVNNAPSLSLGPYFTIAFWFKINGPNTSDWTGLVTKSGASRDYYSGPRAMVAQPGMQGPFIFTTMAPPPYNSQVVPITLELATWYHFTLAGAGDSVRCYLNGKLFHTWPQDYSWTFTNSNPLTLGSQIGNFEGRNLNGALDEVRIYNRPLLPSEISSLYSGQNLATGSLKITVNDAEQWEQPGQEARVILYDGPVQASRATADANSSVSFTNLPAEAGYSYRVFVSRPNPWGEAFWGEKQNLTVAGNSTTEDVFTRNAPYMPDLRLFIDETNEFLPDGGGRLISPGTRLRVELQNKNPSYEGAEAVSARGALYVDRDKKLPYDLSLSSAVQNYAVGTTKTVLFYFNAPTAPGDYSLSVAAFASSARYGMTLTDGVGWRSPAFSVAGQMVAYYPLNGNAYDSSGFGNNGLIVGGVSPGADRHGAANGACRFDGTGYITVPDSPTLHSGGMYSMAFWFQAAAPGANDWLGMVCKAATSLYPDAGPRVMLHQPYFTGPLYFDYEHARIPVELGAWYHCALTSDSDSLRMYLNGHQVSSWGWTSDWTFSNPNPMTLGGQNGSFHSRNFLGSLDEVRIYNRPLTSAEITDLYKGGGGPPGVLPPWKYANTGTGHTIIVPLNIHPTVNGLPLSKGDYLGVFFDSSGTLACAGYERWPANADVALSAFGDDLTTPLKDGFATGEQFHWRVFRAGDGRVYDAVVTYAPIGGIVTNTDTYVANGISQLASLSGASITQSIPLRTGWSLISSYIVPANPRMDSVFKPVRGDLIIVKNGAQKTYIPSVPVNTIGSWITTEGYQVKMSAARTLSFTGRQVHPESTSISFPLGWSIMPYLRDSDVPIVSALNPVVGAVTLVKDQDGRTYIPSVGVNTIGYLTPGQAYQIKMSAASSLTFPGSQGAARISGAPQVPAVAKLTSTGPPWLYSNTGVSHTIIVPASISPLIDGASMATGDYIGVFYDSSGTLACAGYEPWSGSTAIAVAAFGDDPTTQTKDGCAPGETMKWKIWRRADGRIISGQASFVSPGGLGGVVTDSDKYTPNGISALSALNGSTTGIKEGGIPAEFTLNQNYPNPFNPSTTLSYGLARSSHVRLSVLNSLGQEISVLVNENQAAGYYEVRFDATGLASGVYFCRIRAGAFVQTRKLLLVR